MRFTILPYGDRALLINFEQKIDPLINDVVVALKNAIEQAKIDGITYFIPAYCSLTIGYKPEQITYPILAKVIEQIGANDLLANSIDGIGQNTRQLTVPVCYEMPYALDLESLASEKGISVEQIIKIHTSHFFKVYMLGFLPGFVFMGKVPEILRCNRKVTPRLRVPASSVGIAGFQTGIYPTESPGGWQIIGRTPWKIFNPNKEEPFAFRAGDEVRFQAISKEAFLNFEDHGK